MTDAIEIAIDALRDLEIRFSPPDGMSIRQATIAEAQRLVRNALSRAQSVENNRPREAANPPIELDPVLNAERN